MKALYAEKDRLVELRDRQREDFSNHRDYERELRTVSANIDIILGKNREKEQELEKGKDLQTVIFHRYLAFQNSGIEDYYLPC